MPPEISVPDVIGEITGYRAWRVVGSLKLPLLQSVTHREGVWHPDRWTFATCNGNLECRACSDGRVPGENCSCGLYAARDRRHLSGMSYNRQGGQHPVLIGEVGLAGKVIPGSQGWRAEKGRVKRLFVPFHHYRWMEPIAALYNVPVQPDNVLKPTATFEGR